MSNMDSQECSEDLREVGGIMQSQDRITGNDFCWSVFSSAACSYSADTLLRPFPPMFQTKDGEKDLNSLRAAVKTMPSLSDIEEQGLKLNSTHEELFEWVIGSNRTKLHQKPLGELKELQRLTGEQISLPTPQYLFELVHNEQSEEAFTERRGQNAIIHAYHGSKPENFHSILRHGLHAHMNKTSLYGEGTYLSTEPTVAMGFSPWGATGWPNSTLGDSLSIIALCEVIDHPSVKHKSDSVQNTGARAPNSIGGDVPDKYMVVTNNEMVRVKYLLVYAKKTTASVSGQTIRNDSQRQQQSQFVQWLHRHSNVVPIILYTLLLIFIGLLSSKRFWKRFQQIYEETFDKLGWTDHSVL